MQQAIQSLLEQHLSDTLGQPVRVQSDQSLGGGCINHASRINTSHGTYFVKWNDQGPADMFLREAECLEALAASGTPLVIPHVYVKTKASAGTPALLVTDFLEVARHNTWQQDEALGRGIAELHRHQQDRYGFDHDNYCGSTLQDNQWNSDWVDFFGQQRIGALVRLIEQQGAWGATERKLFEQLQARLPALIGHRPAASLNHGDLWSGNYLYTTRGPALIDPASYYADRECDLALMAMFGGYAPRVWEAYQEAYPLPPAWQQRRDLYMLYHSLNHFYLFGGGYGQQSLSIARKYLD